MNISHQQNQNLGRSSNYSFTEKNFEFIRKFVLERTGINFTENKKDLIYGRVARRIRSLGLNSFDQYCDLLRSDTNAELEQFTNAITTNLTSFFREKHHFDFLKDTIIPEFLKDKNRNVLRIWSAGCSTGEEAYSIAITVKQHVPENRLKDIKILATDLDSNVVQQAVNGIYDKDRIGNLDHSIVKKNFKKGIGTQTGNIKVSDDLSSMIEFKQQNLMEKWSIKENMDVVFCRNVVIYFNKETQIKLFNKFSKHMTDKSYLFIGHSETLHNTCDHFELKEKTIYRKIR